MTDESPETLAQAAWIAYRDEQTRLRNLNPRQVKSRLRRREFIAGYLAALGVQA